MFFKVIFDEIIQFLNKTIKHTHKEGYAYILISFVLVIFGFVISAFLGFILLLISMWCIYFFRDPERIINPSTNIISSPADGVIVDISRKVPPQETGINEEMQKISIFLNVFNVHVNRLPLAGQIERVVYHKGKFLNAGIDKASEENERNTVVINSSNGKVAVIQIAGLIARRIICNIAAGQNFQAGERYGIIKFGSRVDLYFPLNFELKVQKGQIMVGGETIIAEKNDR
jgi:phosphatidylserine decarboxylase